VIVLIFYSGVITIAEGYVIIWGAAVTGAIDVTLFYCHGVAFFMH
jgi:hypothetical protein